MRLHPDVSVKRKEINCSMADIHTLRIYVYSSTTTVYLYTGNEHNYEKLVLFTNVC